MAGSDGEAGEGGEEEDGDDGDGNTQGGPQLSFWGVASALTATVKAHTGDLTATMRAKTAEVLTAVQETDWRAELEAFQQVCV